MDSNVKLLVCCHKKDFYYDSKDYLPIHVGKAISSAELGIQSDYEGDNISSKNRSFCELTGMYWAWKNLKNTKYVGLCHYRRYFDFKNKSGWLTEKYVISDRQIKDIDFSVPDLDRMLKKHRIILPKPTIFKYSLQIQYAIGHISDDFNTLTDVINELHPEYGKTWRILYKCSTKFPPYNMFVMRSEDFDRYCSWLFSILFEVENRINISNYNPKQMRIFGYMAERLLLLYTVHNRFNRKYLPIVYIDNVRKNQGILELITRKIMNKLYSFPYDAKLFAKGIRI